MPWLIAPCFALLAGAPAVNDCTENREPIRKAGVAGTFYPADPRQLAAMIEHMLEQAGRPSVDGSIVAAVAPHAGFAYSGRVAASTYAALKGRRYARVVVIGPSHSSALGFTSVYEGDGYATPLGVIPVDKGFARKLAAMSAGIRLSDQGHAPTPAGAEHAIEVQLPWLQKVLDGPFALAPIVMGDQKYDSSRTLGVALARLVQSEADAGETLVLASSDLSHYHTDEEAENIDRKTLQALESWDYLTLSRNFDARVWEACGGAAIVAAMVYAERMGANHGVVVQYGNSGDVTGDRRRVVGYSADLFIRSEQAAESGGTLFFSPEEKSELLSIARQSVEFMLSHHELYSPPTPASPALNRERGVFVTLTERSELRGCIGYTAAVKPLYLAVRDTATLAALRDPRFTPVIESELPALSYEISVLSPLRHVSDLAQIEVGRDGLLVRKHGREGLLLPQVAIEQHWESARFVEETCRKAGVQAGHWNDDETDIFRFTAVAFRDRAAGEAVNTQSPSLERTR